ncbi:DNA adenine methylase [Algimonas porphyrae]|uniref:DNA adenine methylase n=1 Tax=Algimonas porphyrae TaxID=1128113 RepID=A0ABQ5V0P9_9PROT|nr:DNA adenine methylase [Algimonas porphyrae]GLQ20522.1 hypothetical protein GCM10007854_14770 [Algimonas porphyrae]
MSEQMDFERFIRTYDRAGVLFYLDPPYMGSEDDYDAPFQREDFQRLADCLRALKGRFILSINDTQDVRDIFAFCDLQPVELSYQISASGPTKARELILTGGG